jgi:hypothetical protein
MILGGRLTVRTPPTVAPEASVPFSPTRTADLRNRKLAPAGSSE